jgi:hypothetical protein
VGELVYTAEVRLARHEGPDRTAWLPAGEQVAFGVHGPIAAKYGVEGLEEETSTTLDYLVAAAGG